MSAQTTPQTALTPASRQSPNNVGIYIEFDYTYATGFFDTLTLSSTSVEAIERDLNS